jgi:hypothetical protein
MGQMKDLQRKQGYTGFTLINSYQRSLFYIGGEHFYCANHSAAYPVRPLNTGSRLYHTRFFAVGYCENKTKIKIISKNRKTTLGIGSCQQEFSCFGESNLTPLGT